MISPKKNVPVLPLAVDDTKEGGDAELDSNASVGAKFWHRIKKMKKRINLPEIKLSDVANFFVRKNAIVPLVINHDKICLKCHEYDAIKRICCNAMYCDHCYTKDKLCPNCDTATRREKMTGATYIVNSYSEHEECRVCLDPAVKRRCCSSYYCDDCYYKLPKCRSCDSPVGQKPTLLKSMSKAALVAILLGYGATIFTVLSIIASVITITRSETAQPVGIYGYTCYGFFRTCDQYFCLDFDYPVINTTEPIPPLTKFKYCDIDSMVKMQNYGCIFDMNLYISSGQRLGFDLCASEYLEGAYIFEDTFEHWHNISFASNDMKSARWNHIVNGYSSDHCGGAESYPKSGESSVNALTFNGEYERSAETKDVDLRSGGWIEAQLFIAPIGYDVLHPFCKTTYGSYIAVEYSIDGGQTFVNMYNFDGWKYRQDNFFPIKFEVPEEAKKAHVRFKFKQYAFEGARDNWALDNVKIFRRFPDTWNEDSWWRQTMSTTKKMIQSAQCCFDTDWCETRLTVEEMDNCGKIFPFWPGRKFLIRGAELFVCICTFINFIKFCYIQTQEWLMRNRYPFHDEYQELIKLEWIYRYIPARYRPKRSLSDYAADIHLSARLISDLKGEFNDSEGTGEAKGKIALIEAEKRNKEKERKKREKRRLRKKMENKNFARAFGNEVKLDDSSSSSSEEEAKDDEAKTKYGSDVMASKMDKFKRQNVAMLRIPFENKVDLYLRKNFLYASLGLMGLITLIKISTTSYYIVHQRIKPYGLFDGDLAVTSAGLIIFAFYCDFKEIYYNLKYIVPARDQWVPLITIDLTDEVNSLFVGHHRVKLDSISDAYTFSRAYILYTLILYYIGAFPFCTLSLILRDQFLDFTNMRLVTPVFGAIIIVRAFLGSGWILKIFWSFRIFFSTDRKTRETLGYSMQSNKTKYSAFLGAGIASVIVLFVFSIVSPEWTGIAFGGALFCGFLYGAGAGCFHSLPLRPWFVLTTLEQGVWLTVKKDERCPCIYWGSSCNDIHGMEETFIVWTTDEAKFMNYVKNGMNVQ